MSEKIITSGSFGDGFENHKLESLEDLTPEELQAQGVDIQERITYLMDRLTDPKDTLPTDEIPKYEQHLKKLQDYMDSKQKKAA